MIDLPVLTCNRCGECCRKSAECSLRTMVGLPAKYNGRCAVLRDEPDGTATCMIGEAMPWFIRLEMFHGICDPQFHEDRKEIYVDPVKVDSRSRA